MRAYSIVWLGFAFAGALPGCGLTLDYGPPDPDRSGMDGGRADAGPIECESDAVCDDGLSCTSDVCRSGLCAHDTSCPTGTECIARGAGECRRPCATDVDCDDGRACTDDVCVVADGHCMLTSTCDPARPLCLANGSCVPTSCAMDEDCGDQDACNGVERCESGACVAGDPMECPPGEDGSCILNECDPVHGGCALVPRSELCDDGVACTIDECTNAADSPDHCAHRAVDSLCDDGASCTTEACDPLAGCLATDIECPFVPGGCIVAGACDDTMGSCAYEREACAVAGTVCTDAGCVPGACEADADCLDLVDPSGCGFSCSRDTGLCTPRARCAPFDGCAAADAECVADLSLCHYTGELTASRARCDDLDPATSDSCEFDESAATYACFHTCVPDPRACVQTIYDDATGICRRVPDDSTCERLHGATALPDCSVWACSALTGDGCVRRPAPARCDDGASCTADACILSAGSTGACSNVPVPGGCDDGADCTVDACEPAVATDTPTGCSHARRDSLCATTAGLDFECATVFCAGTSGVGAQLGGVGYPTGCAIRYSSCGGGSPAGCSDGGLCDAGTSVLRDGATTGSLVCDPRTGACVRPLACATSTECDDGNACTGIETCVARTCAPGTPVTCGVDASGCERVCNSRTGACELPATPMCAVTTP